MKKQVEPPKDYPPEVPPINWRCIVIAAVIALVSPFLALKIAKADSTVFDPPRGGDCYAVNPFSTTSDQARITREKGWAVLAYSDRMRIVKLVSEKKAEVLLIPDHRICGNADSERKVFSTWYYREKP